MYGKESLRGLCILIVISGFAFFAEADEYKISGTVTGPQGAIEGANVDLYFTVVNMDTNIYSIELLGQSKTDAQGKYAFSGQHDFGDFYFLSCIARKQGLSAGWASAMGAKSAVLDIKLTDPQKIIGFIRDEQGSPVPGAQVRLALVGFAGDESGFVLGLEPVETFSTTTCNEGRFEFGNLPEGASAEILVKKAGMGSMHTIMTNMNPSEGLTYKAGQMDITLTMSPGHKLSGVVLDKIAQAPVSDIEVLVLEKESPVNLLFKPTRTNEDGVFEFADLAVGGYKVLVTDQSWISTPLDVQVTEDTWVEAEVTKGGFLEAKVLDSETNTPLSGVYVMIKQPNGSNLIVTTDQQGIVKKQLSPGDYEVAAMRVISDSNNQQKVQIENGQTSSVTFSIEGMPKLKGVVLGPDGKPVEGVVVTIVPAHARSGEVKSDQNGQFALSIEPQRIGRTNSELIVIAIDEEKGLAGSLETDINQTQVTVNLEKGSNVKGRVLNEDGQPVATVKVSLMMRGSNWGSSFGKTIQTDSSGLYEFKTLPPGNKYSIRVSEGGGYGPGEAQVQTDSQTVEAENIILRKADKKVSGKVVDSDGNSLPDVQVQFSGSNQPYKTAKSDSDGNFVFENICAGQVQINTYSTQQGQQLNGRVTCEGGAEDVIVVLRGFEGSTPVRPEPKALVGKPLPDLSVYIPADTAGGGRVLVFVWDMNQRPSRYFIKALAEKSEMLKEKGVEVILLHAGALEKEKLDVWLNENAVAFVSGIISENAEDMKIKLGVRALPWLILADTEHNVVAEGFSVEMLQEKLKMW